MKKLPNEQRRASRYAVGTAFPLKAVLNLLGRDEYDNPLKSDNGRGWDWSGRLANFSATGVQIQLPAATAARRGDTCVLKLTLAAYQLGIPCHVAHVRPHLDSVLFGLTFDFATAEPPQGYQQLLELVAYGASLKPVKPSAAGVDATGYVVEHYRGDFESHLTVWRAAPGAAVQWFEFQLADYCVRGRADTHTLEFASGPNPPNAQPVSPAQAEEIRQLFRWVVPNIAAVVPADIRQSLLGFAA